MARFQGPAAILSPTSTDCLLTGVPKHAIIKTLAGVPTPTLKDFGCVLRKQPSGSKVPLQFVVFAERNLRKNAILHVDRLW